MEDQTSKNKQKLKNWEYIPAPADIERIGQDRPIKNANNKSPSLGRKNYRRPRKESII